ncbi:hypothetical protein [Roseofilum sp. Guam]|uniref:hypothetical protein n=1 Tax=Roseofilum sp. Guam TaxID=2821502 RepID=UPI001B19064A|nr:hypothetical protein [Roseofilum sp. Guam]MBP0029164.1 hypothetical protein [Roseofilum sp. Guam]
MDIRSTTFFHSDSAILRSRSDWAGVSLLAHPQLYRLAIDLRSTSSFPVDDSDRPNPTKKPGFSHNFRLSTTIWLEKPGF